jgi:hypothetical protein
MSKIKLKPELLSQPTLPRQLHGVNPRTIKGKDWWDKVRHEAYKSTNYHCVACGIQKSQAKKHQWLEAHENLTVDYETGLCEVKTIEPLCHYCHNFIHCGRLSMIEGNEKSTQEVIDILEHGFQVLKKNNLKACDYTTSYAKHIGANTFDIESFKVDPWSASVEFRLLLEGEIYTKESVKKL